MDQRWMDGEGKKTHLRKGTGWVWGGGEQGQRRCGQGKGGLTPRFRVVVGGGAAPCVNGAAGGSAATVEPGRSRTAMITTHLLTCRRGAVCRQGWNADNAVKQSIFKCK